ncbi:MAG: phosphoserine phosphatase SerB [Gammaproteobacteria bacterium]|nr:phosphoserine phosphatase SerB [Gammaproteobacteria bacterium]MDH3534809.1 phosphoserine phosphatase SerB [Gammaproteobacteria bacterium]
MTAPGQAQAPKWLRRSSASQPFVATVCSGGDLDRALAALGAELGELQVSAQRRLAANACDLTFESQPGRAWALFQTLREKLCDADVYVQPVSERGKRLLICDMDMTIVAAETLDEVAAALGMGERIAAITARAMHGEIDFNEALRERIAMLAGQPEQVFHDVARQVRLNPGAENLVAGATAAGVHTILISGGFTQVAQPIARRLGFDEVHCNRLELESGQLTGRVREPIINADLKCQVLQQRAQARGLTLRDCCAIGDGANDLPMLTAAGLGIGYHAKPVLRAATSCHIDASDLDSALYFMGVDPTDNSGDTILNSP